MTSVMRFLFSTLILVFLYSFKAFSQQDSLDLNLIIEKAVKASSSQPVEKVYLHFDKPYYALGDTVYFKAYLTMSNHLPSQLSKVVYVDIIAGKDSLVRSLKLPVVNSVAQGSLTLAPLSFKDRNYRVRAYTNWMFNFKDDYFFYKTLIVGDAIEKQLVTHVSYRNQTSGKNSGINARVVYKDMNSRPYADKKVNWKVMDGYDVISKGKGTTDANGTLNIKIDRDKRNLDKASLVTSLEITDLKSVSTSFSLQSAALGKDVQFFPEGGNLIDGVPSKVAVKAIKSNGLGIDVKGQVIDNEGKIVSEFSSQHAGMGVFTIVPEAGKKYIADIMFADGTQETYFLPAVKSEGMVMTTNNNDSTSLSVRIVASTSFFEKHKDKTFYLIARSSGNICYAAQLRLQRQVVATKIDKSKFPTGIAQLTLMASSGQPLSERLFFVYRPAELSGNLKTDKAVYAPKQKVMLNFSPKVGSLPAEGNFSVAVTNESKVPFDENKETTILSSILLSSDLRGYIENPNYYFNKTDHTKLTHLDLLLLTQGYRSFAYADIIANKHPSISFLPEQGIEISGKLRMRNGMPVNKGNVRLIIPDKNFSASALTDPDGNFKFSNVVFTDSAKVTLSAVNNVNSKNMMFSVNGMAFPKISENAYSADEILNIDSTLSVYLENSKSQYFEFRNLQEVVISTRAVKKASHSDYSKFSGLSMMADQEISSERLKGCNNMLQCLPALSASLTYVDNQIYLSKDYLAGSRVPAQVFIKDMPVDVSFLATVDPREIESIEVFYKDGLSGINRMNNTNGIVIIHKKEFKGTPLKGNQLQELFPPSNILNFTPQGYSKVRQFYVPKYNVANTSNRRDLRTTVYWNPAVITDAKGGITLEFYNGDLKGTYRAVIEGIDKDGKIGRFIHRYTVK